MKITTLLVHIPGDEPYVEVYTNEAAARDAAEHAVRSDGPDEGYEDQRGDETVYGDGYGGEARVQTHTVGR